MHLPPHDARFIAGSPKRQTRTYTMTMRTKLALMLAGAFLLAGCESTTTDDSSSGTVDLMISSITTSPGSPSLTGEAVTVTVVVGNTGSTASTATTISCLFDSVTTSKTLPAIASGATTTITFTLATPSTTGSRTAAITLDPSGTVSESDEADNTGSVSVVHSNQTRNFAITAASLVDNTLQTGATATVNFTVSCQYDSISGGGLIVGWRIVREDTPGTVLASGTETLGNPGSISDSATFTNAGALGEVDYLLILDPTGAWTESAEADNTATLTITWSASG